jgi:hypothetical protein
LGVVLAAVGAAWVNRAVHTAVISSVRAQLGWGSPDAAELMRTWWSRL